MKPTLHYFWGSALTLLLCAPAWAEDPASPSPATGTRVLRNPPAATRTDAGAPTGTTQGPLLASDKTPGPSENKEAKAWPDRIGPFGIADASGRFSLDVGLAVQLQLQVTDKEASDGERDTETQILLRRVRPTLKGTLLTKDLSWYLHLSTAPGSIELMDFYMDYSFSPYLQVRVGQHKIPFTRYRTQSFKNLTFVDWSLVTKAFGAERQMGLTLHDGYEKPQRWEYALGLYTGNNARASHGLQLAPVYGEKVVNPSDLTGPSLPASFHPEIVAHAAYNSEGMDISTDTDWQGGPIRVHAGFSFTWDARPDAFEDLTLRLAPEVLVQLYHVSAMALLYLGFGPDEGMDSGVDPVRLSMLGAVAQTSVLLFKRFEVSLRYAMMTYSDDILSEARDRAAALIANAKDETSKKALTSQYKNAGSVNTEHEATVGFNVYIIGQSLKLRTDLGWKVQMLEDDQDPRYETLFRTQLQLTF